MDIKFIEKSLKPLRKKIHFEKGIRLLLYVLAAAGLVTLALATASLIFVIPFVRIKMLVILGAALIGASCAALFLIPSRKQVMIIADSLGLKERIITAWYLKDDNSPVSILQRQDTKAALEKTDLKTVYKIKIPQKLYISVVLIILSAFLVSFIPGRVIRQTQLRESLITEMKKQEEILEKELEEQKEKNNKLSDEQLKQLQKALEKLKEDFKKAKSEEDALKALAKMENLLEKLKEQKPLQDLKALENKLAGSLLTEDLAKAMEDEDTEALEKALEELKKEMEEQGSQEELSELLKQAANSMDNSSMMSEALEKLASSMGNINSDVGEITESLQELLEQALENAAGEQDFSNASAGLGEATKKAKLAIANVDRYIAQSNGGKTGSKSGEGGNQSGENSGQPGKGQSNQPGQGQDGQSDGQSNQPGQGQGNQPGQGNAAGQGKNGGQGAGSGSTNEDAGYNEGDSSGAGRAPGDRKENEFQSIYVPNRLGGDGNESVISGNKLESGSSTFNEADGAPVQKGVMLPWREVLSEYREEAVQSMDRQNIPAGMELLVRDYFSSLE